MKTNTTKPWAREMIICVPAREEDEARGAKAAYFRCNVERGERGTRIVESTQIEAPIIRARQRRAAK